MEKAKYVCVFEDKQCPVKAAWKLSPESLAPFCMVCMEKTKWDTIMQAMKMMAEMAASLQKNVPSKEFDLEKLKVEREIEMRKIDLEEKKLGCQKS